MTNTQIKYVIEVAKTGSINQAARNLFISQSALSNAVMSVENEFGRKIFIRSARGITLTSFGKVFLSYITPINIQLEQLFTMRENSGDAETALSFSVASNGFHYISDAMATLYQRYHGAGIHLGIFEDYGSNAFGFVANHTADIGIVRFWSCYHTANTKQLAALKLLYHPLANLELGVSVGEHNPLFYSKEDYVKPDTLAPFPPIIYQSIETGPYADIFNRLKIPVRNNKMIIDSRASIYELLGKTDGYCLNSKSTMAAQTLLQFEEKNFPYPQRFLRLENCSIKSEIGWISCYDFIMTPIAREFITMIDEYLNHNITPGYKS